MAPFDLMKEGGKAYLDLWKLNARAVQRMVKEGKNLGTVMPVGSSEPEENLFFHSKRLYSRR